MKILIIEDNDEVRDNICELLILSEYEVSSACNGLIGIQKIKEDQPDLILCDIMMPELDGLGVLNILSKNQHLRRIPFIFLTARIDTDDIRKGMSMGAADYITKPFESYQLLEAVQKQLEKAKEAKELLITSSLQFTSTYTNKSLLNDLQELNHKIETSQFAESEILFSIGDAPKYFYFLQEGQAREFLFNNNGKELTTNIINRGEFIGLNESFNNVHFSRTISLLTDAIILKYSVKLIHQLILKKPIISMSISSQIMKLNDKFQQDKLMLAYGSVREKSADAILKLIEKDATENVQDLKCSVSRDVLASLAGIATESFIRTLSQFRDENLIQIKGKEITILNYKGIQKLANRY